ncbi:MAG: MBL fold metallo-hydrolase [Actinomycetota bacterium]|nr:MBL fold metallo-hydrolase [Actinomycetota bacterium]
MSWDASEMELVAPGVHRVPLPLPGDALKAVNVYVIEDGDGLVLIDSGQFLAEARVKLEAALASLGAGLGDVRDFLVTHIHRDHYTQAIALRREFGTRVSLGVGEAVSIAAVQSPATPSMSRHVTALERYGAQPLIDLLRRSEQGDGDGLRGLFEPPDAYLEDQSEVELATRALRVVSTPGHTRGHVVFVDEEQNLLFAGDHVLPHITPSIAFEPAPPENPLGKYLASLSLMRGLPDARLLPAHGPVSPSVHARVDELVLHHERRLDDTLRAVAEGRRSPYDAAQGLLWTRREKHFSTLDPFNQMLAVLETKVHLDLLVAQGRLDVISLSGVLTYRQPPAA